MSNKLNHRKNGCQIQLDLQYSWKVNPSGSPYLKVDWMILNLKEVEVTRGNIKEKMQNGEVKLTVKGILMRDYDGKFERSYWRKFLRGLYEKWVITSRVKKFEDDVVIEADKFLQQAKAYLNLEGKR